MLTSGPAEFDDHSTVWRLNGQQGNWGGPHGDRARLPGQKVSSGRAISQWSCLESQIACKSRKTESLLTFWRRSCPFRAEEGVTDAG